MPARSTAFGHTTMNLHHSWRSHRLQAVTKYIGVFIQNLENRRGALVRNRKTQASNAHVLVTGEQFLRDRRGVIPIVPFPLLQIFDGVEYRDVDRVRVTTSSLQTPLKLHNLAPQLALCHNRGRKPAL